MSFVEPLEPRRMFAASPTITWTSGPDIPIARFEANNTVVGGKLYVMGGFTDTALLDFTKTTEMFDRVAGTWSSLGDMPAAFNHAGVAHDGRYIYLAGGFALTAQAPPNPSSLSSRKAVLRYDTQTDMWDHLPALPRPRGAGALVRIGRILHFTGGLNRQSQDEGTHWVLNLDDWSAGWVIEAPMPNPRNHLGYARLDGKMYVVGGQHQWDEANSDQVELDVFDPATGVWTRAADLPEPLGHIHESTTVLDGDLLVMGGETTGGMFVSNVEEFDPVADAWSKLAPLPEALQAACGKVVGGEIVVTGGKTSNGAPTAATYIGRVG